MNCVRCSVNDYFDPDEFDGSAEDYLCLDCEEELIEIGRLVALEVEARGHIQIDREPRGPTVVRTPGGRESSAESLLEALRKNKEIT